MHLGEMLFYIETCLKTKRPFRNIHASSMASIGIFWMEDVLHVKVGLFFNTCEFCDVITSCVHCAVSIYAKIRLSARFQYRFPRLKFKTLCRDRELIRSFGINGHAVP